MKTIAWLFILVAAVLVRGVSKGIGVTELPSYLGDLMVGAISADQAKVRAVLTRTGKVSLDSPAPTVAAAPTATAGDVGSSPAVVSNVGLPVNNGTQARLIELGHVLKARGVTVGEGPAPFGPVHRVHSQNSYHYRNGGMAFDLNYDGKKVSEAKYFDTLADQLVASGWRVIWRTKGHYDHIHVDTGKAGRVWL